MTVVHYEQPTPLPPSKPGDELVAGPTGDVARLRAAAEYAGYIGNTEFVPEQLRGRPAAIAAAMLAGAELGLTPMVSLRTVAIIKGRPTLTAEAQRALVTSQGHELWFEESTTTRAIAAGRRQGSDRVGRITWTLDDAKRAGIAGQHNWRAYPAEMLRARASAALARAMFADVTLGIPASEELEDETANGVVAIAPTPAPADAPATSTAPTRTRRRRPPVEDMPAAEPASDDVRKPEEPEPAAAAPAPDTKPDKPPPAAAPERTRGPVTPTPPADTQPEPPAEPDPATEPPATDAQKRQIFALMRDVGLDAAERDARLDYTIRIIGRSIETSNDLTIREAGLVIEDLQAVAELPADRRAARIAGEQEATVLEQLGDELDATDVTPDPAPPPQAYNEFPDGF